MACRIKHAAGKLFRLLPKAPVVADDHAQGGFRYAVGPAACVAVEGDALWKFSEIMVVRTGQDGLHHFRPVQELLFFRRQFIGNLCRQQQVRMGNGFEPLLFVQVLQPDDPAVRESGFCFFQK